MDDPAWLSQYTTKTRSMFRDLLRIHDRVENKDIDIPPEVEWIRDMNDSLHRIDEQLKQINHKTGLIEGVSRALASMFKVAANDVEKVYPSKKK